jgi:succinate dehydrogenase / fumarate reductase, cytochrome b subunit
MSWLRRLLGSSLGKKYVMALSGLALVAYLIVHVVGNLTLYADRNGAAFDRYAAAIEANPFLPLAEIGLAGLFLVHILFAVRTTLENRRARTRRYHVVAGKGAKTFGSTSMIVTGAFVLAFLIVHIIDFRIGKLAADAPHSLAQMVRERMRDPLGAAIYVVGSAAVGIHLTHGIKSAFQSLGLQHANATPQIARVGVWLAIAIGVGFASFPLYYLWSAGTP